jgi:hypothetical protein
VSICFYFFLEKLFLLSRAGILLGPLPAKDPAVLSRLWSCFSVSEVFIGQSREAGGKDIPEKGLRKVYSCSSERMASSTCGVRRALAQSLRGCLEAALWRRWDGASVRRNRLVRTDLAGMCESFCRPRPAGLTHDAAAQGHFVLGRRFFQNTCPEISDRMVREIIVIREKRSEAVKLIALGL